MCVNDVLCTGAQPLFFLDYVGLRPLDPERVAQLVEGVADGCRRAGCRAAGRRDGRDPGAVCRARRRPRRLLRSARWRSARGWSTARGSTSGDVLVGLAADGAALQRLLAGAARCSSTTARRADAPPACWRRRAIYAPEVAALLDAVDVRALCHVTGGGIEGNLPRVLPDGRGARVDAGALAAARRLQRLAAGGRRARRAAPRVQLRRRHDSPSSRPATPTGRSPPSRPPAARRGRSAWSARHRRVRLRVIRAATPADPLRVAVLVSGTGTNLQALLDTFNAGAREARVVAVASHAAGRARAGAGRPRPASRTPCSPRSDDRDASASSPTGSERRRRARGAAPASWSC